MSDYRTNLNSDIYPLQCGKIMVNTLVGPILAQVFMTELSYTHQASKSYLVIKYTLNCGP